MALGGASPSIAPLATPQARRVYAGILALSAHARADQPFLEELSTELRRLVPFDAAAWSAADPLTTLATSPARIENLASVPACTGYWESEFLAHDFIAFRDLVRGDQPTATLFRATDGHLARSPRYRLMNGLLGLGDELRAVFRAERAAWGLVSLWRHADLPPFTPAEERLLADLSAPVAEAFRRTALLYGDGDGDGCDADAPGVLTLDEQGGLSALNEPAKRWLRELEPTAWDASSAPDALRTELLSVAARCRAISSGRDGGEARVHLRTHRGRWVTVHASQMQDQSGGAGRTTLVIEPARPSQVMPVVAAAYALTPRERQVVEFVSCGLSTAEMAERLFLSPHTVRDYVKQAFQKVGVSSRGELVARIFFSHYAQPYESDMVHAVVGAAG